MNLYMKQKVFTWGDKFSVYDEFGNEKYYVEGEVFSWGKKLHIYDLCGRELIFIRQKVFSFLPKYFINKDDAKIAEVVKELAFFRHKYRINGFGWEVQGDFLGHDYKIYANNQPIANVSKKWFTFGDSYEINVATGVDEVAVLAVVLVIDACIEAAKDND